MGKKLNCLAVVLLFASQSVEAHRKYSSHHENADASGDNGNMSVGDNSTDDMISNNQNVNDDKSVKKFSSADPNAANPLQAQNGTTLLPNNNLTSSNAPTDLQVPLALKGVGVPGSPYQKEVSPTPKDRSNSTQKTVEDSQTQHGHLIQIPK